MKILSASAKNLLPLFILFFFLTGCITAKKMDKYVTRHYGESVTATKTKSDFATITSPLVKNADDVPSMSQKKLKKILPLILYIQFGYKTTCKLNPVITYNQFSPAFISQSGKNGLRKKLDGDKLELSIEKVPQQFSFNDDSYIVLLLIGWDKIYTLPKTQEMVVNWKVTGKDGNVKNGTITVQDPNNLRNKGYFKSVKRMTSEYLDAYDENIKIMARAVADEINNSL